MEQTFGIVKPNSIANKHLGKILTMIEESGLDIVEARMETLSKSRAEGFYAEHKARPFFRSLVDFMTSGRVLLMKLEGKDAVTRWRNLMGATNPEQAAPGTIRKLFADNIEKNSVHGSDSPESAKRELNYFFG